ncbi:hypothetical protein SRABI96_01605 [Peribacillus sp. Bi96]|nr:hypothetical protein [Peribacillus sp. Bi96]CAH0188193.1 hypothetical protein SRABI96_01605 [Peribacillus sp. Bi96]
MNVKKRANDEKKAVNDEKPLFPHVVEILYAGLLHDQNILTKL